MKLSITSLIGRALISYLFNRLANETVGPGNSLIE